MTHARVHRQNRNHRHAAVVRFLVTGYWLLVPVLVLRLLGTTPVFIKEKMGTVSLFVDS